MNILCLWPDCHQYFKIKFWNYKQFNSFLRLRSDKQIIIAYIILIILKCQTLTIYNFVANLKGVMILPSWSHTDGQRPMADMKAKSKKVMKMPSWKNKKYLKCLHVGHFAFMLVALSVLSVLSVTPDRWMTEWPTRWPTGWQGDQQKKNWQTGDRQADRPTGRQADRVTDRLGRQG